MAEGRKLKVLSAGAVKGGVAQLAAEFGRTTGQGVDVDFAPAPVLRDRIAAGEAADVLILPESVMNAAVTQGKVPAFSGVCLGRSRVGVAVHAQAPAIDLSDTEAFKRAMLGATAVIFNDASSGEYVAKLLNRLELTSTLGSRVMVVKSGAAIMEYVAEHPPAAVGLAQISEIMVMIEKGCAVRLAAPLPDEIQNSTAYFAAVPAQSAAPQPAGAFVKFLVTPAAKATFVASGID